VNERGMRKEERRKRGSSKMLASFANTATAAREVLKFLNANIEHSTSNIQ
jgi:hypothetical protein